METTRNVKNRIKALYESVGRGFESLPSHQECIWRNHLEAEQRRTHIEIDISYRDDPEHYQESFYEYYCEPQELLEACQRHGFQVLEILDGENFVQPKTDCQRFLFVAEKVIQCQS